MFPVQVATVVTVIRLYFDTALIGFSPIRKVLDL